jgi:hypothetical protein
MASVWALGCVALGARAQLLEFCELTEVTSEALPNGVRIHLKADGIIRTTWNMRDYFSQDEEGEWHRKRLRRFTFLLWNVRGAPAPMVSVGIYPVSHLEFEVPPGARESVGLLCTLVLYKEGTIGRWVRRSDDETRGREDELGDDVAPVRVDIEPRRDRQELIIFVTADRPIQVQPVEERKIRAQERLQVELRDGLFHVDAVNTDLHELVHRISVLANVPVYLDDHVQRRASVELVGVTLEELLTGLVAGYGLGLTKSGVNGRVTYFISSGVPDTASAYWTSEVRHIPLHHIPADSALHSLPDCLLPYVHPDRQNNALVVAGPPSLIEKVARDVAVLDQPVWYTNLRGWVVECTASGASAREVALALSGGDTRGQTSSAGDLWVRTDDQQPKEILVRLRALREKGLIRVRAFPSISVANGRIGELFIGEEQYIWRLVGSRQEIKMAAVAAGTRLWCRPYTGGQVVNIKAVLESNNIIKAGTEPTLAQRRVATTLCLRSGQTVVAGGLRMMETTTQRVRPWPLGGWPITGPLIQGQTGAIQEKQLWVLLQPRVRRGAVPGGDEVPYHGEVSMPMGDVDRG